MIDCKNLTRNYKKHFTVRSVVSSTWNVIIVAGNPLIERAIKLSAERSWRNFVYFG